MNQLRKSAAGYTLGASGSQGEKEQPENQVVKGQGTGQPEGDVAQTEDPRDMSLLCAW